MPKRVQNHWPNGESPVACMGKVLVQKGFAPVHLRLKHIRGCQKRVRQLLSTARHSSELRLQDASRLRLGLELWEEVCPET